jgi:uncharacterized lipoprotein YmbA
MTLQTVLRWVLAAPLVYLALTSCSTIAVPEERFHTLRPLVATHPSAAITERPLRIAISPVTVPNAVDRPQWVVRRGATQLQILEQQRWAQPLAEEIADAVAAQLRLAGHLALTESATAQGWVPQVKVQLAVNRFDTVITPGTPASVNTEVFWQIRCDGAKGKLAAAQEGIFTYALALDGAPMAQTVSLYDQLATLHAQGLAQLTQALNAPLAQQKLGCAAP